MENNMVQEYIQDILEWKKKENGKMVNVRNG